jgi:hypothetical protein
MSWTTVYIKGNTGFESEVLRYLEKSGFSFLPGTDQIELGLSLYWINDLSQLREFKKAIGAKTIFKYRLHFFSDLEKAQEENINRPMRLTAKEEAMVRKMSEWQEAYNRELRHSA